MITIGVTLTVYSIATPDILRSKYFIPFIDLSFVQHWSVLFMKPFSLPDHLWILHGPFSNAHDDDDDHDDDDMVLIKHPYQQDQF